MTKYQANLSRETRAQAIAAALAAAERAEREGVLRSLEGITLSTGKTAPLDECWLAAERAFLRGEYRRAAELFEALEAERRSASAPLWQRYRSSRRLAFCYLHQGSDERSWPALQEAERRLQAMPDRDQRKADLNATHGHLLSHQGQFEQALNRFVTAYEEAEKVGNWHRMAGGAADASLALLRLGRLVEMRQWLDRAETAVRHVEHTLLAKTIDVRRGHYLRLSGKPDEAEPLFSRVLDNEQHPDLLEGAYRGRAEVRLLKGDFAGAEADLRAAAKACLAHNVRHLAAYCYRDLANVYARRDAPGDSARAADAFRGALRIVLMLRPALPIALMDLADELIRNPTLLGSSLSDTFLRELQERVGRLRDLARPPSYQQAVWLRDRATAYRALRQMFTRLELDILVLHTCTVNLISGALEPPVGKVGRLTEKRMAVVGALLAASRDGLTIGEIAERLQWTFSAASRQMMHLRRLLGASLGVRRYGNTRRYYLRFRTADQGGRNAPRADASKS